MAEKKPSSDKKKASSKKPVLKKPVSMRESAAKKRAAAAKPKRVRKAAEAATKPAQAAGSILTKEIHVLPKSEKSFWTRSRHILPRYFRESWAELKQVTWPGRIETWRLVGAVFMFSIVVGVFVWLVDMGFERLFKEIIL